MGNGSQQRRWTSGTVPSFGPMKVINYFTSLAEACNPCQSNWNEDTDCVGSGSIPVWLTQTEGRNNTRCPAPLGGGLGRYAIANV